MPLCRSGPVLKGTALRDSLEFVKFGDFVNQVAFAEVATALNERARRSQRFSRSYARVADRPHDLRLPGRSRSTTVENERLEILPVVPHDRGGSPMT